MKNLEKEYKEQISLETPDLWSRIEAGVDAYEASKAEAAPVTPVAPVEAHKDNIVKFNSKKCFNILGKISVAAIIFLVVAATYNVTRHSRKDTATAPSPAEATISYMPEHNDAAEATQSEAEVPQSETEASQGKADAELAPIDSFKEAEPADITDLPIINESPSYDAEVVTENELFKKLSEIGFNNVKDFSVMEDSADGSVIYGPEFSNLSLTVASFKAGIDKTSYLLYYSTEYGTEIYAVQDEETGEFIYINPTE